VETITAEVCVLGSGPAGAAIASRLACLGHNVVLIGDEGASRRSRLESVSPGILPFLAQLDLETALEKCAVPCEEPIIRWETAEPFARSAPGPSGHLLDRNLFDSCLLKAVRRAGVHVLSARIREVPERLTEGGAWRVRLAVDGGIQDVYAHFLIVATGRKPLLPQPRKRILPPLLALQARWLPSSPVRPRISVEALRDGWVWGAPLPDGSYAAVAFLDPPSRSRRRGADATTSLEERYHALLSETTVFGDCLHGPRLSHVTACDTSAFLAEEVIGSDWMLVGDSAVTLEPISAQGVQVALKLGCQGAAVVHTLLSDASSVLIAESFYRDQCRRIAARHVKTTRQFYAAPERFREEPFWRSRAFQAQDSDLPLPHPSPDAVSPTTRVHLSPEAELRAIPCLIGDRICLQTALEHPSLDSPVSHLGDIAVATLLLGTTQARAAGELCRSWVQQGVADHPLSLLYWFLQREILVPM
jgi:2-polyprenyl-6-methoxyphenol hydroxylase-like FAD-dependent oxidoreductase